MSELSIHADRMVISHKIFRGINPHFDVLEIETEDHHGTKNLVKIFLPPDDSEHIARAVSAFNAAFEIEEATP